MGVLEGCGDAERRFPLPSDCAAAQQLPERWAGKVSSAFLRLAAADLRLTHRLRGCLQFGKKDFKATSDL
ncbi:Dynein Heavy Chain 9, Axonemal [Manis pentadactyla]|nr:Dynein Heavy Chain 9, Axonemal [Manis pentadactyla]